MARYRKIDVRIRADAKFRRLSAPQPNGQSLWFHLLTGQHTGAVPGLSSIGEAAMAEDLGWPLEGFREAFREVFREGMAKADWKARVVWVPNVIKYDPPQSPNVVKSWRTAWDEMPECALKLEAWHALRAFLEGKGKAFLEAFLEACPKPLANPEPEPEPDHSPSESVARAASGTPPPVSPGPTLHELQALWNERLPHPPFPRWREIGSDQRRAAKRVRERPVDGPDGWLAILQRIGNSGFCRGVNDRGWVADPDFLLRAATPRKVLEGKYDDRAAPLIPMRRPFGGLPPEPPPPALAPGTQLPVLCDRCGERIPSTWDGERWLIPDHEWDGAPCVAPDSADGAMETA